MKGAVSVVVGLGLWCVAEAAAACTRVAPPALPGETGGQRFRRMDATEQMADWRASSTVYVGRVVSVRLDRFGGRLVEFEPVRRVKGGAPPRRARWHDPTSGMCGTGYRWTRGETAVVFARRITWRDSLRRMGQAFVYGAYRPEWIVEPAVARVLRP